MRALSRPSLIIAAFALAGALLISSAAVAGERGGRDVVINIGKDGDLLTQLIEMDAADIEELRTEFAEARAEIKEAIVEIADARKDVKAVPGGSVILKIAFATARSSATAAIDEALAEVRGEIARAERDLKAMEVSAEERLETTEAISVLRSEIDSLEAALQDLIAALKA